MLLEVVAVVVVVEKERIVRILRRVRHLVRKVRASLIGCRIIINCVMNYWKEIQMELMVFQRKNKKNVINLSLIGIFQWMIREV